MSATPVNLGVYEPWYLVPVVAIVLWLVSLRPFASLDEPPSHAGHRSTTIDGLRGFLAFGVFFAHATGYQVYLLGGPWGANPSVFYAQLGSVGVALFFMITSYLFWGKAAAGAKNVHDAGGYGRYLLSLYVSRLFRIAPLYYAVIAAMLVIVFAATGLHLAVTPVRFAKEIANWMALGLGSSVWINGYREPPIMTGVVWTLGWEWFFYLSLAFTSLAAFSRRLRLPFACLALLLALAFVIAGRAVTPMSYVALFSVGMVCASLPASALPAGRTLSVASVVALVLLVAADFGIAASRPVLQILLLAVFFYLIIGGCDLFRLLRTRAAQRLGVISYGIYLTHGICLHVIFWIAPLRAFALRSTLQYWCVVLLAALAVTIVSSLCFVLIERPGIALGRALLARSGLARGARGAQAVSVA